MTYEHDDDADGFESNADRGMRTKIAALEAENARLRGEAPPPGGGDAGATLREELAAIPDTVQGPDGTLVWNPDAPRQIAEAVRRAGGTISGPNAGRYA